MPQPNPDLKCICIELRNAAQALTRIYDDNLQAAGISVTQISLLNHVQQLDTPTLKELAEVTQLDRSTLGRNLRLLEKQGLVHIAPGQDARTRVMRLTAAGKAALRHGAPLWLETQTALVNKLGPRKRALLTELLTELTA